MVELPVQYLTLRRPKNGYYTIRALSERVVRQHLRKKGYVITRGTLLDTFFYNLPLTDNARIIQEQLTKTLTTTSLVRIAKYCEQHHGTPDFLAWHPVTGVHAIEVKLGHETIKEHQLTTMQQLIAWGVPCTVYRVVEQTNKVRQKTIDLAAWSNDGNLRGATNKRSYERRVTVYGQRKRL